jgi:hypothetical protein
VGAVSLQVVLSGLRMVAIFLVMLAGRGRAHFFWHDIEADPRVSIPIGEEAGRSKGLPSLSQIHV